MTHNKIMVSDTISICPGCNVALPTKETLLSGDNFERYGVTSPECLDLFHQVLAKEYEYGFIGDTAYAVHAYAVQHPPRREHQKNLGISERYQAASSQSVIIHQLALHMIIENKLSSNVINRALSSGERFEDIDIVIPHDLGSFKVVDALQSNNRTEHLQLMQAWAKSAWHAWTHEHPRIKKIYEKYR